MSATQTVDEARKALDDKLLDGECVTCPVCDQTAKIYRRPLSHVPARVMIAMLGRGVVHVPSVVAGFPDIAHQGGYATLGCHWGLIEEEDRVRDDGGRAGYWSLTDLGTLWVKNEVTVKKYALLYSGELITLEGPEVSILDVLGKKFNYRELMAA